MKNAVHQPPLWFLAEAVCRSFSGSGRHRSYRYGWQATLFHQHSQTAPKSEGAPVLAIYQPRE